MSSAIRQWLEALGLAQHSDRFEADDIDLDVLSTGRVGVSGRKVLEHAGAISAEAAKTKAEQEYARYHALVDAQPRAIDAEFEKVTKQLTKPAGPRGKKGKKT